MNDNTERLGQAIDSLENIQHALSMNLPDKMHLDQMRRMVPEIVKELKESFIEVTGENPWE